MTNSSNSSGRGMGFAAWLTILFIGLKLTGFIAWSWWWVLGPLWIVPALFLGFSLICFMAAGIITAILALFAKKYEPKMIKGFPRPSKESRRKP